jgi:hypothetical protein
MFAFVARPLENRSFAVQLTNDPGFHRFSGSPLTSYSTDKSAGKNWNLQTAFLQFAAGADDPLVINLLLYEL